MTPEQQRKMLECTAKACGLRHVDYTGIDYDGSDGLVLVNENGCHTREWNPRANPANTAEMCAKLDINTFYYLSLPNVECSGENAVNEQIIRYSVDYADNPGEKLKAWMFAATMVAAKIGGYEE